MKLSGQPFALNLFRAGNDKSYISIQIRDEENQVWKIRLGIIEDVLNSIENIMQIFESPEIEVETNESFQGNLFFLLYKLICFLEPPTTFIPGKLSSVVVEPKEEKIELAIRKRERKNPEPKKYGKKLCLRPANKQ